MDRRESVEKLEKRLIEFSVMILNLTESLPESKAVRYLSDQLIRSGTSPALNYGEARSAESSVDFIHKMKVCLKELREAYITLQILQKKIGINKEKGNLEQSISECNELISIFVKSIQTAEENRKIKPVK
ncbi:MAG: four helix bundle protein [Bacteroidota bacterium]|jgi:four helix bundle protein